jgi:hypothetical protein
MAASVRHNAALATMHVRARPGNPPATWATGVHLCLVLLVTQSWCATPMVSLVGAAVLPTSCLSVHAMHETGSANRYALEPAV